TSAPPASAAPAQPACPAPVAPAPAPILNLYDQVDGIPAAGLGSSSGAGVGIAIIDSGIAPVPDLGTRATQVALPGQTGSLDDVYGHGTFVASIAAGKSADETRFGIAPGASIYALNVNRNGSVYSSDIIAALAWVAQ